MEVSGGPSTSLPPLITSPATGTKQDPRKTPASSPKRVVARDTRLRGAPSRLTFASGKESATTRSRSKSTRLAPGASRPIVPLTERRAHEERDKSPTNHTYESGESKWEVAPDGASAGREGRQFTVANVGNHGRIYLRYVFDNDAGFCRASWEDVWTSSLLTHVWTASGFCIPAALAWLHTGPHATR